MGQQHTTGEFALKVVVRLFASYRDKVGQGSIDWELPAGATVGNLANDMSREFGIIQDPAKLVVAVNEEYREHDYVLSNGDEVALIPPVSGGGTSERQ